MIHAFLKSKQWTCFRDITKNKIEIINHCHPNFLLIAHKEEWCQSYFFSFFFLSATNPITYHESHSLYLEFLGIILSSLPPKGKREVGKDCNIFSHAKESTKKSKGEFNSFPPFNKNWHEGEQPLEETTFSFPLLFNYYYFKFISYIAQPISQSSPVHLVRFLFHFFFIAA